MANVADSRSIVAQQNQHQQEERCQALRALLMTPLMTPAHAEFAAVRRHADELRAWFARETGWALHIERDCARLYKRPADLLDASRGLPGYERRRYVLLCLACAVLERADAQITLRVLGERLLVLASEPTLMSRGYSFALQSQHERRELVAVCRSLLEFGVLQRVAGDEEGFVRSGDNTASDALYDVQRRVLAGMLAAVRGPSTWSAEEAPVTLDERLAALVTEHVADSDEGQRTALRHHLSRRLLDDPVVYLDALDADLRAYFMNQRGPMAARLCDATDLSAEQRAEGLALVDEGGTLTDVAMPSEGTPPMTMHHPPALPTPERSRWQPLRLGLVELFHYDSEEFWFRDGHLLLRGNNGTGKSKVLSLTLPFLLDAQLKSSRIEPDGDPGKKMAWNLLLGRHDRRMGYATPGSSSVESRRMARLSI